MKRISTTAPGKPVVTPGEALEAARAALLEAGAPEDLVEEVVRAALAAGRASRTDATDAARLLHDAGFEPLEPYPGRAGAAWAMRCADCGNQRRSTLSRVRGGERCTHRGRRMSAEEAAAELRTAGFDPLEDYPGRPELAWTATCLKCGRRRRVKLGALRRGARQCSHGFTVVSSPITDPAQANEEMRAAGFEVGEPYPGKTVQGWTVRCAVCKKRRRLSLARVRAGERCSCTRKTPA